MLLTEIVVKIFKWLLRAPNGSNLTISLYERINVLMTNVGSKNLMIEFAVAKMLRSDHVYLYLLLKKHTCVKFYFTNILD